MDQQSFREWQGYISNLGAVLQEMQKKPIIALGVAPYPRIIPALFLQNYAIYCVKNSADIDVLRAYARIYCLEERHPKIAKKCQATSYLLKNFVFQSFLKSRKQPVRLMFYQTTKPIIDALDQLGVEWIGNNPDSFSGVLTKGDFRDLTKKLSLPSIPDWRVDRDVFIQLSFKEAWNHWDRPFVVQRADIDVAGEMGTFFVRSEKDWNDMMTVLSPDTRYKQVTISPFIEGYSLSMLGCVTSYGVFTSTLHLQLIDVPESLFGQMPTGVFLGHDWTFREWPRETEAEAEKIVEVLGAHLSKSGYKGIFGIDFLYDKKEKKIFPIECNPRFTGALPMYSLMTIATGAPPMELFHIAEHLGIPVNVQFDKLNRAYKNRIPLAHIALTPKGIHTMPLNLESGIYTYDSKTHAMQFERKGAFPWDFKDTEKECLLIDSLPRLGAPVIQNVPRLCKIIFPRGIATSSFTVKPDIGQIIEGVSAALREEQEISLEQIKRPNEPLNTEDDDYESSEEDRVRY